MLTESRRSALLCGLRAAVCSACLCVTGSASAKDSITLAINNYDLGSQVAQFIAQEKGYFSDEGLDVKFASFDSGALAVAAVLSGQVDLASAGVNASLFNGAGKGDLKLMAATVVIKAPVRRTAFIVTNANWNRGVREVKDLGGLRLAMTTPGTNYHYSLLMAGRKFGFKVDQSKVVPLGTAANVKAAVSSGSVDGAVYPGNVALELQTAGLAHIVGDASDFTSFTTSTTFATKKDVTNRRDVFVRFHRANLKATRDYYNAFLARRNPDNTIVSDAQSEELVAMIGKHINLSHEIIRGSLPYLQPDCKLDVSDLEQQISVWKSVGLVSQAIDVSTLYDLSVMDDAAK